MTIKDIKVGDVLQRTTWTTVNRYLVIGIHTIYQGDKNYTYLDCYDLHTLESKRLWDSDIITHFHIVGHFDI